jgi:hypothetical protein
MNCGRDEDPLEMFTRAALVMPSRPTVAYVLSGTPYWTPADCVNVTRDKPRRGPLSGDEQAMLQRYRQQGAVGLRNISDAAAAMHSMTFLYKSQSAVMGIPAIYSDVAPMAQVSDERSAAVLSSCRCAHSPYVFVTLRACTLDRECCPGLCLLWSL